MGFETQPYPPHGFTRERGANKKEKDKNCQDPKAVWIGPNNKEH